MLASREQLQNVEDLEQADTSRGTPSISLEKRPLTRVFQRAMARHLENSERVTWPGEPDITCLLEVGYASKEDGICMRPNVHA